MEPIWSLSPRLFHFSSFQLFSAVLNCFEFFCCCLNLFFLGGWGGFCVFFFFAGVLEFNLIFAISTHSNYCLFIQLLVHITDAMKVKEKTNSNECRDLFQWLLHILLLQKCLAVFVSLMVG